MVPISHTYSEWTGNSGASQETEVVRVLVYWQRPGLGQREHRGAMTVSALNK